MILKLFDSLTPLDQLLLKCASIIGETVNRHMLENLMGATSKREIGLGKPAHFTRDRQFLINRIGLQIVLAITKLFEIRIFGCAIGDFSRNTGPIIFIKNMRSPTSEMDVFCGCIGLTVPSI